MIKQALRQVVPSRAWQVLVHARIGVESRLNARRSAEEVFTRIYRNNRWGGQPGQFCSGSGTTDLVAADRYESAVAGVLDGMDMAGTARIVDLGCGDFRIGQRVAKLGGSYVGVDVVQPIIDHLRAAHGTGLISFEKLDIVSDPLPAGDVCLLRQVLQHLSNDQIGRVLGKLSRYPVVIVTEHYPDHRLPLVPNLDKIHGADIRMGRGSAVCLDEPPFAVPSEALELILDIPMATGPEAARAGSLRTHVYRPGLRPIDHT